MCNQAAAFPLAGNQLPPKWHSLIAELLEILLAQYTYVDECRGSKLHFMPTAGRKEMARGGGRGMIDNSYALARSLAHTQTQLSKKTLASRVASIKPSMNQGRRHIIHPRWDGRLYGTELLNPVLIGAHEGKCKMSGKKRKLPMPRQCVGPK